MTKLSIPGLDLSKSRLKMVMAVALVIGGLYFYHMYVLEPLQQEKEVLKADAGTLDGKETDVTGLGKQLQEAKEGVAEKEKEVKDLRQSEKYQATPYVDFVRLLGELEDTSKVRLISVIEHGNGELTTHQEVPYDIEVAGTYTEILHFVNDLYKTNKFHIVTGLGLKNGSTVLTSDKNHVLNEEWATEIKASVDENYSSDMGKEGNVKGEPVETEGGTEIDYIQATKNNQGKILHLNLSMKFIRIDNPEIELGGGS